MEPPVLLCLQCGQDSVVEGRLLCPECAETLDDGLASLLEAEAPDPDTSP